MGTEDLELTLADGVAVGRAADALGLCLLSEGDGDAETEAENRRLWEEGTVRVIVRALFGVDCEDPDLPTACIVIREGGDEHIEVQATFTPPFNHHDPSANSMAHLIAAGAMVDLIKQDANYPAGD